jgi:hypothetical protein
MKFLISIEVNTKNDKVRKKIFRDQVGIQNLLTELEDKWLQWFGQMQDTERDKVWCACMCDQSYGSTDT